MSTATLSLQEFCDLYPMPSALLDWFLKHRPCFGPPFRKYRDRIVVRRAEAADWWAHTLAGRANNPVANPNQPQHFVYQNFIDEVPGYEVRKPALRVIQGGAA